MANRMKERVVRGTEFKVVLNNFLFCFECLPLLDSGFTPYSEIKVHSWDHMGSWGSNLGHLSANQVPGVLSNPATVINMFYKVSYRKKYIY